MPWTICTTKTASDTTLTTEFILVIQKAQIWTDIYTVKGSTQSFCYLLSLLPSVGQRILNSGCSMLMLCGWGVREDGS